MLSVCDPLLVVGLHVQSGTNRTEARRWRQGRALLRVQQGCGDLLLEAALVQKDQRPRVSARRPHPDPTERHPPIEAAAVNGDVLPG